MKFTYPANIEQDEAGHYLVTFPDVPEAMTDAREKHAAVAAASDALAAALAGYVHRNKPLPRPSAVAKRRLKVAVPGLVAAKLALYDAVRTQGISNSELARRLGKTENAVRRLLDPDHSSKWENVEAALIELGHKLIVEAA